MQRMSFTWRCIITLLIVGSLCGLAALAQVPDDRRERSRSGSRPGGGWSGRGGMRGTTPSRDSFPTWETSAHFKRDLFTFARIEFDSDGPFGWHDRWDNDIAYAMTH